MKYFQSPVYTGFLTLLLLGLSMEATAQEPKSTHTWLQTNHDRIDAYSVDLRITDFPQRAERSWLYYFALQVNFTDHDEWSHGGIQWAGVSEFVDSGNKGVNWGGGSDWAGYGGIGRTNTPYLWKKNTWYRFRVERLAEKKGDLYRWAFYVMDYPTQQELYAGTVNTKSKYIKDAVVWMETGYGVVCDTDKARIEWRNPKYRIAGKAGDLYPTAGTVSYKGTCTGPYSTEQKLISNSPLTWSQETKAQRTQAAGVQLFSEETVSPIPTVKINGKNVSSVSFPGGVFQQQDKTKKWIEAGSDGEARFQFRELGRDEWSVYLCDRSRKIWIALDLWTKKVKYKASRRANYSDLYNIQSVN